MKTVTNIKQLGWISSLKEISRLLDNCHFLQAFFLVSSVDFSYLLDNVFEIIFSNYYFTVWFSQFLLRYFDKVSTFGVLHIF